MSINRLKELKEVEIYKIPSLESLSRVALAKREVWGGLMKRKESV
jgi:hypothetical protein